MSKNLEILVESLRMLLKRPLVFVPKLASTLASSVFIVFFLSNYRILSSLDPLSLLLISFLLPVLLTLLGVLASLMVASMVKNSGEPDVFRKSIREASQKIDQALKVTVIFFGLGLLIATLALTGYSTYIMTGNLLAASVPVLIALVTVLAVSYAAYFLPATLLEFSSLKESFFDSYRSSNRNRTLVTFLVVFSALLLGLAFFSTGYMEKIGYIGFIAGRLVSTIVNTYVFVVSPNLYFSSPESFD